MLMQPIALSTKMCELNYLTSSQSGQSSYSERLKKSTCQHCDLTLIISESRSIKPEETLTKMFAVHSGIAGIHLANRNTLESILAVYLAGHSGF